MTDRADRCILIVEDNLFVQRQIANAVIHLGNCMVVRRRDDARQHSFRSGRVDLAVIDLVLPDSANGLDTLRSVRDCYDGPAIVLTGIARDDTPSLTEIRVAADGANMPVVTKLANPRQFDEVKEYAERMLLTGAADDTTQRTHTPPIVTPVARNDDDDEASRAKRRSRSEYNLWLCNRFGLPLVISVLAIAAVGYVGKLGVDKFFALVDSQVKVNDNLMVLTRIQGEQTTKLAERMAEQNDSLKTLVEEFAEAKDTMSTSTSERRRAVRESNVSLKQIVSLLEEQRGEPDRKVAIPAAAP